MNADKKPFDIFLALDGPCLNGWEGPGGILKLRYFPDDTYDIKIKFYDSYAGGHAVQVNNEGTIGYLGGVSRLPLFFDTNTLEEITRFSSMNYYDAPIRVPYESQTHVVFLTEKTFLMAIGPDFVKFNLDNLDKGGEKIGPHKVTLPHAVKLSHSKRYLYYGAMDHDYEGFSRQFGIFDLQEPDINKRAKIVNLDDTAWHFGMHPTEDIIYAVSEGYDPKEGMGNIPYDFNNFSISYRRNYAWKIDGKTGKVLKKAVIPAFMPSHLTSDVVVTGDENDRILYNSCASNTITIIDFKNYKVSYIDEKVTWLYALFHPGVLRQACINLLEAFTRVSILGNLDRMVAALRTSRGSLVDGSYALQLSPDKKLLFSGHRGLNQIIVYNYPDLTVRKRINLPPARKFFKGILGVLSDPRLGMHHGFLSTTSVR